MVSWRIRLVDGMVYGLATWTALFVNFLLWEGLYVFHYVFHLHRAFVDYQLNVWPILVAIIILMSGESRARAQARLEADQQAMLDAQTVQTQAIEALLQNAARQTERMNALLIKLNEDEALDTTILQDIQQVVRELRGGTPHGANDETMAPL